MANKIISANTTTVTNISSLEDKPSQGSSPLTSAQVKALFDKTGSDLKTWINGTLNEEITKNSIPFAVGETDYGEVNVIYTATITGIDTLTNGLAVAIEFDAEASVPAGGSIKLNLNSLGAVIIATHPYDSSTQAQGTIQSVLGIQANSILTLRYSTALTRWIVQ